MESLKGLNIAKYKPPFKSEFSMGELDFKRFNHWLEHIETYSSVINSCSVPLLDDVQYYFAGLNVLYKQWRCLISVKPVLAQLDAALKECRELKRVWELNDRMGTPFSTFLIHRLVDNLDAIHTKLMDIKQVIGLGIVVRRMTTTRQNIRMGIQGNKNYGNLPEA